VEAVAVEAVAAEAEAHATLATTTLEDTADRVLARPNNTDQAYCCLQRERRGISTTYAGCGAPRASLPLRKHSGFRGAFVLEPIWRVA
jgi:hypothetical protein